MVNDLLTTLSAPQRRAVNLLRIALAAYNTREGTGLFQGVSRYSILTDRIKIAAIQSRDLPSFWSALLRKLLWPVPPKKWDAEILDLLNEPDPAPVLRTLALEAPYIVMLARYLHDGDKATRRWTEEPESSSIDDTLETI